MIERRVEAQDGGDPKVDASPRDIVYTELAEPVANSEPQIIAQTDLRYGYLLLLLTTYISSSGIQLDCSYYKINVCLHLFASLKI